MNLCYAVNNMLSVKVKLILNKYFYSTFSLLKFLSLSSFSKLFGHFEKVSKRHVALLRLINVNLKKLDFLRCIRVYPEIVLEQIEMLIERQTAKFHNCKI